jgi:hypothetical protein
MDDDEILAKLRSADPDQQEDGAFEAGELGILGVVYVNELVALLDRSDDLIVRHETASALMFIARDGGLGPDTTSAVPNFLAKLRDADVSTDIKLPLASALSYCVYDIFPDKMAVLENAIEAVVRIEPPDRLGEAVLVEALQRLVAMKG